jgi:hypothetical protein
VAVLHDRRVSHVALELLVISVLPSGIRVCVELAVFTGWQNAWTNLDEWWAP